MNEQTKNKTPSPIHSASHKPESLRQAHTGHLCLVEAEESGTRVGNGVGWPHTGCAVPKGKGRQGMLCYMQNAAGPFS